VGREYARTLFFAARYSRKPAARALQRWRTRAVGSCDTVCLSEGQIEMAPGERSRQMEGENVITAGESLLFVPRTIPADTESSSRLVSTTVHHHRRSFNGAHPSLGYFTPAQPCAPLHERIALPGARDDLRLGAFCADLSLRSLLVPERFRCERLCKQLHYSRMTRGL